MAGTMGRHVPVDELRKWKRRKSLYWQQLADCPVSTVR
jgi:hypothetical protein